MKGHLPGLPASSFASALFPPQEKKRGISFMGECWSGGRLSLYLRRLLWNNSLQGQSHGGTRLKNEREGEKKLKTVILSALECGEEGAFPGMATKGIRAKGMRKREGAAQPHVRALRTGRAAQADARVA